MKSDDYKRLARQIITITADSSFVRDPNIETRGYSFSSTEELVKAYNTARDLLLTEFKQELSPRTVNRKRDKLIGNIYDLHGVATLKEIVAVSEDVKKYISIIHAEPDWAWEFVVVLEKLTLSSKWDLGNFAVLPGTPEQFRTLKEQANELLELLDIDEEKQTSFSLRFDEMYSKHFVPKPDDMTVLLTTTVMAKDHEFGRNIAIERFNEAINFLRFLSMPIEGKGDLWAIGYYGDVAKRHRNIVGYVVGGGLSEYYSSPIHAVELDKVRISKQDTYFKLAAIPANQRTNLQQRVFQAIHWLGQTAAAREVSHKYLFSFTAIESLLIHERTTINRTLPERCAFLIGTDLTSRKNIVANVMQAYNMRSDITHGGVHNNDDKQLSFVITLAYNCVAHVVDLIRTHNWSEPKQLTDYLDDLKFA